MRLSEQQQARIREIQAPAKAEGRDLTAQENKALTDLVFSFVGVDVTDSLDAAAARRLSSLLLTRRGAGDPTREAVAFGLAKPNARERYDHLMLLAVFSTEAQRVPFEQLNEALDKRWISETPPPEVAALQMRLRRHKRWIQRLVQTGCVRRGEV